MAVRAAKVGGIFVEIPLAWSDPRARTGILHDPGLWLR